MSLTIRAHDLTPQDRDYLRHALAMDGVVSPRVSVAAGVLTNLIRAGVFARTEDRIEMYRLTDDGRVLAEQVAS